MKAIKEFLKNNVTVNQIQILRNVISPFRMVGAVLSYDLTTFFLFEKSHVNYKLDANKRTIATIISCFNYFDYSRRAIDSYYESIDDKYNYVLIVVDDHSSDETKDFLSSKGEEDRNVCYFRYKKNMGLTQTWNDGVRFALKQLKADYIFLVNSDVIMPKDTLSILVKHMKDNKDIGVVGPLTNSPGHQPAQDIRLYYKEYELSSSMDDIRKVSDLTAGNEPIVIDYVNGFFMGFPRATFEKNVYGNILKPYYFNPLNRNVQNEDEFQSRLRKLGLKSVIARDAFVFHYKDVTQHRY